MLAAMELRHEFSWSASRRATFERCRRQYYFVYYLSWLGWKRGSDADRRRAYELKQLTRFPMQAGECVHRALAHWLEMREHGISGGASEVEKHALGLFRDAYRESRSGPATGVRYAEHHYSEPQVDEESGRAAEYGARYVERIRRAVRNFFELDELRPAREAAPETYLALEEMRTFDLAGVPIHATPDFAHAQSERGPRRVRIYDWKTGAEREEDRLQLGLYALFAREVHGLDPHQIRVVAAYLDAGTALGETPGAAALAEVEGAVAASAAEMRALHFDAGVERGDAEAFPQVPSGDASCRSCNFRELCDR